MSRIRFAIVASIAFSLAACSGGGGGGSGKSVTGTTTTYSPDGATQYVTTIYSDGSKNTATNTYLYTDYSYSSDGSQLIPIYHFLNGAKNNGIPVSSKTSEITYSSDKSSSNGVPSPGGCSLTECNKFTHYTFPNGLNYYVKMATGSLTSTLYAIDAAGTPCTTSSCSAYLTFSFTDNTSHQFKVDGGYPISENYSSPNKDTCTATKCDQYAAFYFVGNASLMPPSHLVFVATGTPQAPYYGSNDSGSACTVTTCNEYVLFNYSTTPLFSHLVTLAATQTASQWGGDHVTKTVKYTFADTTSKTSLPAIVEPTTTNLPSVTQAADYPNNWTTNVNLVQKPIISSTSGTYADNTPYLADGTTAATAFRQSSLTPNGPTGANAITDPNAFVAFGADAKPVNNNTPTNMIFDLRWGTPDPAGPGYVTTWFGANGTATAYTYPAAITIAGRTVSGQSSITSGMTLATPTTDVKTAWSQGWTGKGQNILMIDGYPNPDGSTKPTGWTQDKFVESYTHGITTYLLASRYAQGASFFLVDGNGLYDNKAHIPSDNSVPLFQANTHGNLANSVRSNPGFYVDVINISLGYNYWEQNITNPTAAQIAAAFTAQQSWVDYYVKAINGTYSSGVNYLDYGANGSAAIYLTDAVVAKAAGNDAIATASDPLSYSLAYDSNISSRLLLVGALENANSSANAPKQITNYSNVAGSDLKIQSRFLAALDGTPYKSSGVAIDGTNVTSGVGTSYAAPRVAGYAAIVRQKFPNLTAPNTADILLVTARYDTLKCYPNCDKAIYGQGEASLSRALAPVGYLR